MYRYSTFFLSFILFSSLLSAAPEKPTESEAGDVLNSIVAVVGNKPITRIDLDEAVTEFKSRKGVKKTSGRNEESQVLDLLISRAIVDIVAREESISISDLRVNDAIERDMEMRGFKSEDAYDRVIRRETGLSLEDYRKELRHQLKTQQVVNLKVTVENPTPSQVEEWYRINKSKIGKKYLFRIIQMKYSTGNTQQELQVSKKMKTAQAQARRSEQAFIEAVKNYSDHPSKNSRGGLIGPLRLDEIAQFDPTVAGMVQNTQPGRVSPVFVGRGAYYTIRVQDARDIGIEEIYDMIHSILYRENQEMAFQRWVAQQRRRESVTVFLGNYESER